MAPKMRTKLKPEEPSQAYLDDVLSIARDVLGEDLLGLYIHGSTVQGDFRSATSDIDLLGVVAGLIADASGAELASRLDHSVLPVPAAGLELILIPESAANAPVFDQPYEFALSTGVSWPLASELAGTTSDILIHMELCRLSGRALFGQPPAEVFAPVDRAMLCRALVEELFWHKEDLASEREESTFENTVINAARSVLMAETGRLMSKSEGAREWLKRIPDDDLVTRALACRSGEDFVPIDRASAEAFLDQATTFVNERLD